MGQSFVRQPGLLSTKQRQSGTGNPCGVRTDRTDPGEVACSGASTVLKPDAANRAIEAANAAAAPASPRGRPNGPPLPSGEGWERDALLRETAG